MQKYGCHLEKGAKKKTDKTGETKEVLCSKKQRRKKTAVAFDVEEKGNQIFGVNLMCIPGISEGSLLKLIGELGHDFTDKFENYKKLARWANVVPNNKITGGKLISSKVPKRKNHVGQILREAANSAGLQKPSW